MSHQRSRQVKLMTVASVACCTHAQVLGPGKLIGPEFHAIYPALIGAFSPPGRPNVPTTLSTHFLSFPLVSPGTHNPSITSFYLVHVYNISGPIWFIERANTDVCLYSLQRSRALPQSC